ncbi:PAS domain S-box protein [Halosimplex salinum]|uniref:PAS domain S-box protein n=1 Tax=Halosimplex salinum TaxID=1710538 RepID=UPI0013DD984D|nr:PAS domain S-box protein [Halosimplex salinum]
MTDERPQSQAEPADGDQRAASTERDGRAGLDPETLEAAVESTAAGILAVDAGTVAFANPSAERYLGRSPGAIEGTAAVEAFPERVADLAETVASTGAERTAEWTETGPHAPEGGRRVAATLSPASAERVVVTLTFEGDSGPAETDGDGAPAETDDDSDPVQTDDAHVAGARLDAEGRITAWSGEAESLTDWSEDAAVGAHVSLLAPDDAGDDAAARPLERARSEGTVDVEGWCLRSDGSKFWAATTVSVRRTDDGGVDGYRLTIRDRTDRKRLEEERELLAAVNHAVADAETFRDGVETTLEAVCERTQWAYGEAWVPAADGDYLEHLVAHAADERLTEFLRASRSVTFRSAEGLPGRVWASASAEWIPDASAEPTDVFHRTAAAEAVGLQAALGVPIVTDGRVVAVLAFFLTERRSADEELVDAVTDVVADLGVLMARKRAEDRLERERSLLSRVFETSPVGLLVTDTEGTVVRANARASRLFGRQNADLTGSSFAQLADTVRDGSGDPVPADELPVARVLATGEAVSGVELELALGSASDDTGTDWVSVSAAPIRGDDGAVERVIAVVEDVTERREREQSLRTFREAVEQAGHSVYVTDTDGRIEYVNPTFERVTGYGAEEAVGERTSILNSGEHDDAFFEDLWETIVDGDIWTGEVVNRRKSGETYVVNQTIAPIADDSGAIERFVAINDEITEQKRRERELRRQRNSLERIKQIIESLRPINRALARADTREAVDRELCELLTASDAYLFAWIGDYNSAVGAVTPREWAGVEEEFVRTLDLTAPEEGVGDELVQRAVADGEVQVVREIPTAPTTDVRRDRALTYGYQSLAVVPVVYGDTVLGVFGAYSARPDAFDEYEQGLLRELGERVGHAINAAENRQLLHTDTVVELEFEVGRRDSAVVAVASELGCWLSVNSVTPAEGGTYAWYLAVDGAAPAAVTDEFDRRSDVERARVVEAHGRTGIVEVTGRLGPIATLVEHGATVRSFEATGDRASLRCETAPQSDIESLITDLEGGGEATVFVAKRTRDRDMRTLELTKTAVEERLTDRQREALALAYHAGYFASPRHSTGEDLAEVLGIASPTFYQHVREGTRKILELLLGDDEPAPTGTATLRQFPDP